MVDLNSSDYGLSTLNMRPAVLNVVNGCVADAPISIAKYGTDGRVEHVNSNLNNIDLSTLGFTGVFRTDKGDYYAGNVSMSMDDLQSGNYDKEAMVQSVLDSREYDVRVSGPLDYTAITNQDQTEASIDLVIDDYCFAIDLLFRTNASEASLFLQTDAIERVDNEDYEYLVDFSSSGSYIEIANTQLSSAIRLVFADTYTGQVYALAQVDPNGKLHMTAVWTKTATPSRSSPAMIR